MFRNKTLIKRTLLNIAEKGITYLTLAQQIITEIGLPVINLIFLKNFILIKTLRNIVNCDFIITPLSGCWKKYI